MKKTPTFHAEQVNGSTFLAGFLLFLSIGNYWMTEHTMVSADFFRGMIPSIEALVQWAALR